MKKLINLHKSSGFTLVELAIVLVIIAIVIAGILKGQDMLNNMKLNAVIVDLKKYSDAYEQFKEKYNFPPGDHPDASATFGANNNGDGSGAYNDGNEGFYAWQHLALTGFIEGAYAGTGAPDYSDLNRTAKHAPDSPYPGAPYIISYAVLPQGGFNFTSGDIINLGLHDSDSGYQNARGIFTPREAYWIDTKMDNDDPSSGKIWARDSYHDLYGTGICITWSGDATADEYNTSSADTDTDVCYIIYMLTGPYRDDGG